MKTLGLLLTILILSSAAQAAETEDVVAANPLLVGKWTGEGGFLNAALDRNVGKVSLEIEIKKDHTVSGRIGDANLTKTSIGKAPYGFEIRGVLDSPIKKDTLEKKNHLIVLLLTPSKNAEGALVSDANFHLKSNYLFDFTMQVGGVMLKKQP